MRLLPLALPLVLVESAVPQASVKSSLELARAARESVVLLKIFDSAGREIGSGTGFAVGEHLLATNHHVAEEAARIQALRSDEKAVELLGVVAESEEHDLALLRVPKSATFRPLKLLVPLSKVEPGERIVVLGSPLGLAGSISEGIVAAVRPKGLGEDSDEFERQPLLQITAPISPGSSGSPILNDRGEVIGVAAAFLSDGQNLNLAIPSQFVATLRQRDDGHTLLRRFSTAGDPRSLLRNAGISLALFAAIALAFRALHRRETAGRRPAKTRFPGRPL